MQKLVSVCVLMFCVGGCVLPMKPEVFSGHKFSKEEIAFLNLPNTTRGEVLSTLGDPRLEVPDPGVLLYVWQTTSRVQVSWPDEVGEIFLKNNPDIIRGDPRRWGLFIAYDESGYVTAHEVRRIGTSDLSLACSEWVSNLKR